MSLLVVLPYFSGDEHLLLKNLAWYKELDDTLDYDCLLACDKETKITAALKAAQEVFRRVDVFQYARVTHSHWPWPQNNAFMNVAWYVHSKHKGPWFWCETDSIPTKKGWLDTLWAEYQLGKKPFGGHWNSETNIFNGVAIYPPNIATYSQQMMMAGLVDAKDAAGKPYQPPWDYYGSKQVQRHLHVMNGLMQHLWDFDGKPITFPTQESVQKLVRPEVALFHRVKDGSLIDRLREREHGVVVPEVAPVVRIDTIHGSSVPKVEIFIVTYWKDADWLSYCLRSIKKFASGFSGVTVACPDKRNSRIVKLAEEHGATLKLFKEPTGKGHLAQEVIKCNADNYCPDAELILHVDSDCVFTEPVTPNDYLRAGKPLILFRPYAWLKANPPKPPLWNPTVWIPTVRAAVGSNPEVETMAALPIIHPRFIYAKVRAAVEAHTKAGFEAYVYSCKSDWPYGFCEFNTIGDVAWSGWKDSYVWHDVTKGGHVNMRLKQMWSHSGLDAIHPIQSTEGAPREFLDKLLA